MFVRYGFDECKKKVRGRNYYSVLELGMLAE